jgi:hypothetical protein
MQIFGCYMHTQVDYPELNSSPFVQDWVVNPAASRRRQI